MKHTLARCWRALALWFRIYFHYYFAHDQWYVVTPLFYIERCSGNRACNRDAYEIGWRLGAIPYFRHRPDYALIYRLNWSRVRYLPYVRPR